jgi:prepilin-type processing-associated H-X9-DG protein
MPAFDESRADQIDYRVRPGGGEGSPWSPSRTQPSSGHVDGAKRLSTTRAFWMLVRSGDVLPKTFICPTSGDTPDPTTNIDAYYDFAGPNHVSYGYQVPFGPPKTRAGEWIDANVPLAADKGAYSDPTVPVPPKTATTQPTGPDFFASWRPYNSRNHQGEGQNVLYADGHVSFERLPAVGVDGDNIYTVAVEAAEPWGRISGESPWARSAHPLPRFDAFGRPVPTTDTVFFP